MPLKKMDVVFVHGWSVTDTDTYGQLPARLMADAAFSRRQITVHEIFLGKYVSFRDEVRIEDISRGFEAAVKRELSEITRRGDRFACITHSTGGPVIRDWWDRYHDGGKCPMSHLIMLAPANFGSALAQLGKSRLGRIKSWFEGVEPGEGVLDWLELGSEDAWELNMKWINADDSAIGPQAVFPFVLTGQWIDRGLRDNLNTYTDEMGSDGVVRVASANLNSTHIQLHQVKPTFNEPAGEYEALKLEQSAPAVTSPKTSMFVVKGKAHSGEDIGIMRSVRMPDDPDAGDDMVTLNAILRCLRVSTKSGYTRLMNQFARETEVTQDEEKVETEDRLFRSDRYFPHDRCSMLIFRLSDTEGYPVEDYDLLLTAGEESDSNLLPPGFFIDRQRNRLDKGTIAYAVNYDVIVGADALTSPDGEHIVRPASDGTETLGISITPRPATGLVHYFPCALLADAEFLNAVIKPNQTALIDIVLHRVVREGVFRLDRGTDTVNFKDVVRNEGDPVK